MAQAPQLTKEGFAALKKELEQLKGDTRRGISESIKEAKSHGDLKENAGYHEAKLNMDRLEHRIQELEKLLLMAKIVERPADSDGIAHLGSQVILEDVDWGDELAVTLVGAYEADPTNDKISMASPLGEALLNKKVGDEVEVEAPAGKQRFKIRSIV